MLADGRTLSWSQDGTLRLWDGETGAALVTLSGHTDVVWGAQVLADGRILSWSDDHTLRLWDGETGAALVTLSGHTGGVSVAQVLADGRILSWSNSDGRSISWSQDGTLRLWDGETGAPLDEVIGGQAPWQKPDILYQWTQAESSTLIARHTASWSFGTFAGIMTLAGKPGAICWQGASRVEARKLFVEGILVVTLDSGHVFYLQLYRGNRRIGIEDYERSDTGSGDQSRSAVQESGPGKR